MKTVFNQYWEKYDDWYNKNEFAYLSELEAVKKVLPKKGEGLEIGVGTGRFADPLNIKTGIDPSENMIRLAKKRGVNAKLGSGEQLLFKNSTFDYVAIIITLCFVQNPQKVLKESGRVLKEKGKVIVGIIDKNSFLGKNYQEKGGVFYKKAKFFTVKEITGLLENAGFFNFSYYQTLFDLPGKINSIQKPKEGFGQGGFIIISGEKK